MNAVWTSEAAACPRADHCLPQAPSVILCGIYCGGTGTRQVVRLRAGGEARTVQEMHALGQDWPYPDHPGQRAPVMGTWYYEGRAIRFVHDLARAPKKRERKPGFFGLDFGEMVRHSKGYLCEAPLTIVPGDAPVRWVRLVPEMIPVYARFPADMALDVERFLAEAELELAACQGRDVAEPYQAWQTALLRDYPEDRAAYPQLPWTLADLCGSTWRNVHTGHIGPTMRLGVDRFGQYILCHQSENHSLGIWVGGRYCMGHDLRMDHLEPDTQLRWLRVTYTRCRLALCQAQKSLATIGADETDAARRRAKEAIEKAEAERVETEAQARAFAQTHGLLDSAAWRFFMAGVETRQLTLF